MTAWRKKVNLITTLPINSSHYHSFKLLPNIKEVNLREQRCLMSSAAV